MKLFHLFDSVSHVHEFISRVNLEPRFSGKKGSFSMFVIGGEITMLSI